MAGVDDKVVSMSFESSRFESGVNKTIAALEKLKASLTFSHAGKGLEDINSAAKRVDLSHIGRGVDEIRSKLSALSIAATAVFVNIALRAVEAGGRMLKALTLDPIKAGFAEYSTNLNAIQTILANTQASGATLQDVNKALQELNRYSDKTIYNFSQMAKNIGTFTAAGVDLDTAVGAIKGIANLAALSGSSADQASTAMYQLSQAISAGRVGLQDWNSVVNAGMGGTVFQRALAQTAVALGTIKESSLKLVGPMKNVAINGESFRQSMQAGPGKTSWLTSKVLTTTLKQFTGDLTDAQLKAQGFNDEQIKSIQLTAKTAQKAATEVKTISQVFDVAKETAGSGWAQTFQIIFGNFTEAKTTFTALSNAINGFINTNAQARNKVLADWKKLGGRSLLIKSISTLFHNLGLAIAPIKEAFRDIFPATTGKDLFDLTVKFQHFAEALKPGKETIENLKRTFRGLFAVLDIGKMLIGGLFTVLGKLFGAVGQGRGSFLNFTGGIGDFLVSVDEALKKGDRLHNFFETIGDVLTIPIKMLGKLKDVLVNLFGGFSSGGVSDQMGILAIAATALTDAWDAFTESIGGSKSTLSSAFESIGIALSGIGTAIGHALSNMNFEVILAAIRTGLFAALVLMFKEFFGHGSFLNQISKGFGRGIINNISGTFGALQGSMKGLQRSLNAKALKDLAIAIALLVASVVALSFIKPEKLKAAITALAFVFGELLAAMAILDKIGKSGGFIKMPFIAGSLILLATAIDILVIAVVGLSLLSWDQLTKGLTGVGVLLGVISAASIVLSANSAGLIRASISLIAIAIALKILASAMADFGDMSWGEISKGLVGVAAGLAIIAAAAIAMPKGMVLTGVGLIAVAVGLKLLADAVAKFGGMDMKTMGKGLIGIGAGLVIIAGAMHLMPGNLILTAAGLLLVSLALKGIVKAVKSMGGMSIEQIAKGLVGLAGALLILAAGLYAMSGTLGGAAALAVAAAGLALLAPAIIALGKQSWGSILKSMVALAGALGLLGVAGLLLAPIVPALLGLGAALLLIGGGLALAGAGIFLISAGISALVVAGPAGIGILIAALNELLEAIPKMAKNLILAFLEIVRALAATAPKFAEALVKIINTILDVIIKSSPKMVEAFNALIKAALQVLAANQDQVIQAGFDLIIAFLQGIKNNIGKIVPLVADIIAKFLISLANNLSKIIAAGVKILTSLLKGIGNSLGKIVTSVASIVTKFLGAIASALPRIVTAGANIIVKLINGISNNLGRVITAGVTAIVRFVTGIGNAGPRIIRAATSTIIKLVNQLAASSVKLVDAGFKAMIKFLNGLADAIDANAGQLRAAGLNIARAIIDGLTFGLASFGINAVNQAKDIGNKVLSGLGKALHLHSPSKATFEMGELVIEGLANGMSNSKMAVDSATAVGLGIISAFEDVFQITSPSKVMRNIGALVRLGFLQGLLPPSEKDPFGIQTAFSNLNTKLTDSMQSTRDLIKEEQAKLKELRDADKPDQKAIKEAEKVIKQNQEILRKLVAGHNELTKTLKEEKKELIGLANDYQKISDSLDAANDSLKDAIKTRDDAIQSFTDQYSTLPEIVKEGAEGQSVDQLKVYMDALRHQADAVGAYQTTLNQLRTLGLDDATYQKLLAEGTADQQFADALLKGGKTAVDSLNALDKQLLKNATKLAKTAGDNLYQAGVDAAQGLVNGLQSKKAEIAKAMEDIAEAMIKALKRKLKIKSPSEVFAELGEFAMKGMAQGFANSSKLVSDAVEEAAQDALTAMQQSMKNISDTVNDELNPNPVITPVLDLTLIRSQARELARLSSTPIVAANSLSQASFISSEQTADQAEKLAAAVGPSVKFEQNNFSPESLSEIEIYRQTKNQLSQLKSVLAF